MNIYYIFTPITIFSQTLSPFGFFFGYEFIEALYSYVPEDVKCFILNLASNIFFHFDFQCLQYGYIYIHKK